jgi:hypothetical protein
MAAAMFQGRSSLRGSCLIYYRMTDDSRDYNTALPDSGGGGARSVACLRLVLVSIVIGRWSGDLFVIFFYFWGSLYYSKYFRGDTPAWVTSYTTRGLTIPHSLPFSRDSIYILCHAYIDGESPIRYTHSLVK